MIQMKSLIFNKVLRYKEELSKPTKANSFIHMGRVIILLGKDVDGKALKVKSGVKSKTAYIAYDYKTRLQLAYHYDKDFLKDYIKELDLSILESFDSEAYEYLEEIEMVLPDKYTPLTLEDCQAMHNEYMKEYK